MKMKTMTVLKLFIMSVMIISISGCSVNYNLNIDKKIEENITIFTQEKGLENIGALIDENSFNENGERLEGIHYYDFQEKNNSLIYTYKFDFNDYKKSTAANNCLKGVKLIQSGTNYLLTTTAYYSCMDFYKSLDEINININVAKDYEIVENNADYAEGNELSWQVNRQNYKDKPISLQFKLKKQSETTHIEKPEDDKNKVLYMLIGIISCVITIIVIIKLKTKIL